VTESTERDESLPPAEKNGTGELRSDLEPLVDRFGAIGAPLSAVWMSGTTGDDRVPGPTTYWIDAVIILDPATAAALRADFGATLTDESPGVVEGLSENLPAGPLLTSPELSDHTNGGGFGGQAFIAVDSDELVIIKVGGPN